MMKLKELVTTNKGIFSYLNDIKPLPWGKVVTPEDTDAAFMFAHGDKIVTGKVLDMFSESGEDATLEQLAKIINMNYSETWARMFDEFEARYPLNIVSRETINDSTLETGNTTNKVSAYDSENLTTDTGVDDNNNKERNYTKDKISFEAYTKNVELLQDNLIYDKIFLNVKDFITL